MMLSLYKMNLLLLLGTVVFFLSVLISGVTSWLGDKMTMSRLLSLSFECGFGYTGSGHIYFSLRFFVIILVFLIFDAEIILLTPLIFVNSKVVLLSWGVMMLSFLIVLLVGVLYEMAEGVLDWHY